MNSEIVKEIRKCVTILAVVALLVVYSEKMIGAITGIIDVFTPFFAGLAVAFVLNIPMALIEAKMLNKWNGKVLSKIKRGVSMTAATLVVIAVVFLVAFSIVPQIADTFKDIAARVPGFSAQVADYVNQLTKDYPQINEFVNDLSSKEQDWSGIFSGIGSVVSSGAMGNIVSSTVNVASSIAIFLFKAIIAICFAVYLLVNKEKLLRHVKIVFETYLSRDWFEYIYHATMVLNDTFKKFIAGQCLEAVILGLIFAVCMALFRIPYVLLISVLIAFTALIPVAGAFIGCAVGAFLILMVSPVKMIQFLILFFVLQQIENKLIYPRIVGSSVGLPAIWVFVAVTVGGSISGVFGMLVFIPLASTLYTLLKEDVIKKRALNNLPAIEEETAEFVNEEDVTLEALSARDLRNNGNRNKRNRLRNKNKSNGNNAQNSNIQNSSEQNNSGNNKAGNSGKANKTNNSKSNNKNGNKEKTSVGNICNDVNNASSSKANSLNENQVSNAKKRRPRRRKKKNNTNRSDNN